jgi:iron(III) transport system substrate-binding protein
MLARSAWSGAVGTVLGLLVACAPAATPPAAKPSAGSQAAPAQSTAAPAGAAAPSGTLQTLIEGARREGQLDLIWGDSSIGGAAGAQRLADGFNRAYGLNVNVQFTPGPSMPEMAMKLLQEYTANRRASTDVLLATETQFAALIEADALTTTDWLDWAPNIRNPRLLAPGNGGVQISTRTKGITYNSARLTGDAVPTSMQDLLKPQYKGRIATTTYANVFEYLASPQLWGEQRVLDYAAKYRQQIAGMIRCGEAERLVSGEFDILATDCGAQDALTWQAKGAPVAHAIPSDAATLAYQYMGVLKNAAHPNAALLWINYMLGREAQDIQWEFDYADHHLLEGSKVAKAVEAAQARGIKFTEVDVQFYQTNDTDHLRAVGAEVVQMFRSGAN